LKFNEARQLIWTVSGDGTPPALTEGTPGDSNITGAAVPGITQQPFLLRRHARDYSVVDQRGHVTPVTAVPSSAWLTGLVLQPHISGFSAGVVAAAGSGLVSAAPA
jgi:hypothetical protein